MARKKWYSIELAQEIAMDFRRFLQDKRFTYDSSECFNLVHFEVFLTPDEVEECDYVLDMIYEGWLRHERGNENRAREFYFR